jgi:hypothetical protein
MWVGGASWLLLAGCCDGLSLPPGKNAIYLSDEMLERVERTRHHVGSPSIQDTIYSATSIYLDHYIEEHHLLKPGECLHHIEPNGHLVTEPCHRVPADGGTPH